MVEHEKLVGYKQIVARAQQNIYKPRPPSSDSSQDDYAFTLSAELQKKMEALEKKKAQEIEDKKRATDKQKLEEHLKRFRGFGTFKDGVEYQFDENGDLVFESLVKHQVPKEVPEVVKE